MENRRLWSVGEYVATVSVSMMLYAAALVVSLRWLHQGVEGPAKYFVATLPVLPALGIPWAVVRFCQSFDELQLRQLLESLAFAFTLTMIVTITYGFLQNAGLPDVNWVWIWPVMCVCFMIGRLFAWWRYR